MATASCDKSNNKEAVRRNQCIKVNWKVKAKKRKELVNINKSIKNIKLMVI